MPIQVSCPQCERSYKLKDETAGKRFKCKECGATVQVPAPMKAKAAHSAKPKARRTKPAKLSKQRDDDFASVLAGVTEDDYRGEHGELPPLPPRTKLEPQEKASKRKQRVLAREETLEERQRPVSTSDNEGGSWGWYLLTTGVLMIALPHFGLQLRIVAMMPETFTLPLGLVLGGVGAFALFADR